MTFRQWLYHLITWFHHFPKKTDEDHLWVGLMGGDTEDCWVCGAKQHDPDAVCIACRYYPCLETVIIYPDAFWCERWKTRLSDDEELSND